MDKEIKGLIKQLKRHYTLKYRQVLNYLLTSEESPQEKAKNIHLLIDNTTYYTEEIEQIKLSQELQAKEEMFRESIEDEAVTQGKMLDYIKEQISINEELLNREQSKAETTPKEIERKQRKISTIQAKLQSLNKFKAGVEKVIQDIQPQKRKVGRPKKTEQQQNN